MPSDALYTLIADPMNLAAVLKVFKAKGREAQRSLPLLVLDILMAEELGKELTKALLSIGAPLLAWPPTLISRSLGESAP